MITKTIKSAFAPLIFVLATATALAEDIDIFSQNNTITAAAPNVLLVIDNSANWNSRYVDEKAALAVIVGALKTQFNLGIMFYNESTDPNQGAYVRFAVQGMTDSSGNATEARKCLLKMMGVTGATANCLSSNPAYTNLDRIADKSNAGYVGLAMAEAYSYFAGINAYNGANTGKGDPLAFVNNTKAGPQYKVPGTGADCEKNFIIHISNGGQESTTTDNSANALLIAAGGAGAATLITPPGDRNPADEWARYLNKSAVNVVSYTLEVDPVTNGQGPAYTALMQSMGRQGKGGYFAAADAVSIQAQLTRIFNDIQAVNSVFASSSLPLSADNTGAFSDQVYMGVFRPDGQGQPRWLGNLKQYKFAVDNNSNLSLVDAGGVAAAGASGFASPDALSFWTSKDTTKAPDAAFAASTSSTTGSTGGFYFFDSKGSGGNFDSPDGEWVEKGGAAEQLRLAYLGYGNRGGIGDTNASTLNSIAARSVFTCTGTCLTTPGAALSGTPFDSTNTTITGNPAAFGISNTLTVSSISSDRSVATLAAGSVGSPKAVASLMATPSVVTVTTTPNHTYSIGNKVTIAGSNIAGANGTFIVATVTSLKIFTYTGSFTAGTSAAGVTTTLAGNTATVTLSGSSPQLFPAATSVVIAGAVCPPSAASCPLNGTFTVLASPAPTTTSFSYTLPGNGVGATATGTITASATIARATTSTANGYTNGDSVTVAGATCSPTACSQYNGTFTVSNVTSSTFDYSYSAGAPLLVASSSGMTSTNNTAASVALATLLKWIRGQDTQDENGYKVNGANTDVRASIHGDVLHSRPMVLNFGVTGSTDNVYIFYGGNDGVFRAVKGGQAASDGKEQWAFIPQEFFGKFKRLYDNTPPVLYPSTPSGLGATKRDYLWDGPVGSYVERNSSGAVTRAYLYIAARRGGRFIYALDVTSPTSPAFLWKKGCTAAGVCDTGFNELGQTWSQAQVVQVEATQAGGNPVLIFGGGYDPVSEDTDPPAAIDTMGRGVFVLNAFNGSLIWWAGKNPIATPNVAVSGMEWSVAADVLAIDRRQTGFTDRVYAADVGGNLWRLDVGGTTTANWNVWKIASIANRSVPADRRKFLFGPDVVLGDPGTFDAIVIGTGDREHPLTGDAASGVTNRAYMIVDPNTGGTGANLNITESDLVDATPSGSSVDLTASKGWYVSLAAGEKVVNGPIVVASNFIFGTNQPCASGKVDSSGNCTTGTAANLSCTGNLGIARRYDINYLNGAALDFKDAGGIPVRSEVAPGGGFLPSPTAGLVEISGKSYVFVTDNPLSPGGVINPTITVPTKRFRTYWREVLE